MPKWHPYVAYGAPAGGKPSIEDVVNSVFAYLTSGIQHLVIRPSCALTSIALGRAKRGESQAIGRSKGGLSTKIHTTVDALGNPIGFHLTEGQACELEGADVLLPRLEAKTVIADKGFDADKR